MKKLSYDARLWIITDQVYSVAIELKVNVYSTIDDGVNQERFNYI